MAKVLVTGAGGYIGRHVVESLLSLGNEVIAVDINTQNVSKGCTALNYDIFNGNKDIFKELGSPDVCMHLAWKDGFKHNSFSHIQYIPYHYEFLYNMIEGGLKNLLVMGTMHEIGYFEGEINEDTPANPRSLYGIAKNALRQSLFLLKENFDFNLQWCRAFYITGDDSRNNSIFSKLLIAANEGKESFPFNSGKNKYDFINIELLSLQLSLTALQSEVTGIINCCSGKPVALKDEVEDFISKNSLNIKLDYGAFKDRPYDSPAVWGNSDKIRKIINNALPTLNEDIGKKLLNFDK